MKGRGGSSKLKIMEQQVIELDLCPSEAKLPSYRMINNGILNCGKRNHNKPATPIGYFRESNLGKAYRSQLLEFFPSLNNGSILNHMPGREDLKCQQHCVPLFSACCIGIHWEFFSECFFLYSPQRDLAPFSFFLSFVGFFSHTRFGSILFSFLRVSGMIGRILPPFRNFFSIFC